MATAAVNKQKCNFFFVWQDQLFDLKLTDMLTQLKPWVSGRMNKYWQLQCLEICQTLRESNICIRVVTIDDEKSYDHWHCAIFESHDPYIQAISYFQFKSVRWDDTDCLITDLLHAIKCKRCYLDNDLAFSLAHEVSSRKSVNSTLQLNQLLTILTGVKKMDNALAVRLFIIENLSIF